MDYAQLGSTDLVVSSLAFGTAPLGGLFGPVAESDAIALVHEALDLGLTLVDTSPYYGLAEERLGRALAGRRDEVVLASKAGRYGASDFDFSRNRIRRSVENSLRQLGTDHLDILQLHDIEFVPLEGVFEDAYAELVDLQAEGKCRYIGMTGYPVHTMKRAMTETDLDVALVYAHATLLDDTLRRELVPVARDRGVGLINAAAVALGLLTPGGSTMGLDHPATDVIRRSAVRMAQLAADRGVDLAFVANQYAIQRSGCVTTVIGTARSDHLRSAVAAATSELDEDLLLELVALRPSTGSRSWVSGLAENNSTKIHGRQIVA